MHIKDKEIYKCKAQLISGRNYSEVLLVAKRIFNGIKRKSKRRPYIRSAFFNGQKIFFDNFWPHLNQKSFGDRERRMRFFECSVELIEKSTNKPILIIKNTSDNVILQRFIGQVGRRYFAVQIKEDTKRGQRFLMSIFEYTKK